MQYIAYMSKESSAPSKKPSPLLLSLGGLVREFRLDERGLSAVELARRAGLSVRFLHDFEAGRANISVERLADLAAALGVSLSWLFQHCEAPPRRQHVALLGIRGAGKSTVGERLAKTLQCDFFELDALIEQSAGQSLATLFDEVHTPFAELEMHVLKELERECSFREGEKYTDVHGAQRSARNVSPRGAVLATGGSIVDRPESVRTLRRFADTIWLKASPKQHWDRVRKQGDKRPMQGRANARAELEELWNRRRPRYELADLVLDTEHVSVDEVVREAERWLVERRRSHALSA